ncbi:type IV secretory system conjugative DNA transfer family protein [Paenibacillus thiaminolyticus]|nr:TraM recognition domain-containing protein [Paenibacillus thiaminolyticus]
MKRVQVLVILLLMLQKEKLKAWFWKRGPLILLLILYTLTCLFLWSGLSMIYVILTDQFDLSRSALLHLYPVIGAGAVFYVSPIEPNWVQFFTSLAVCLSSWLFSTRVKISNKNLFRRWLFFLLAAGTFVIMLNVFTASYIKPISYDLIVTFDDNINSKYAAYFNAGALRLLGVIAMCIPSIVVMLVCIRIYGMYKGDKVLQKAFEEYKFEWRFLGRFGQENTMAMPDILLALDAEKHTPVVLQGESRQLGTMLIGPPGSGKTSQKISKAFSQDMAHLQKAINAFPSLVKKYGYMTPEFKKAWGKHLVGSIIIEPSKDLCDSAYKIALMHGIPDDFIVYLDPSNPDSPGVNCMVGPVEKVAEMITAVLDGMSEVGNEFFRQACRTVLKQYIYLLKFLKKNDCTLIDLDQMYQDPRYVKDLVEEVRKKVPSDEIIRKMERDKRIYWMLVNRTIRWFDNDGLEEQRDRMTQQLVRYESGPHKGKVKIIDKQSEFTRQTRNLLSDLITNPYLARILIGENEVDLDRLMAKGGILLCNTDNGLLGDISDAFGKMVLMSCQNAVFRRLGDENTRPLVSLYADEFYDYMNRPFLKLAGQGRKYKIAIFVACQSLSQFAIKFDEAFVDGMMGTLRNYIVYGGVGEYDVKKLIPIFGKHTVEEVKIRESMSPSNMDSPGYSIAEDISRKEVELVSEDDIMFNPFTFSYVRLVVDKSTRKAIRAVGDFVDYSKESKWRRGLKEQHLEEFMSYWVEQDTELTSSFNMEWIDTWEDDAEAENFVVSLEQQLELLRETNETRAEEMRVLSNRFSGYEEEREGDIPPNLTEPNVYTGPLASQILYTRHTVTQKKETSLNDVVDQPNEKASASEADSLAAVAFTQFMQKLGVNGPAPLADAPPDGIEPPPIEPNAGPSVPLTEDDPINESPSEDERAEVFPEDLVKEGTNGDHDELKPVELDLSGSAFFKKLFSKGKEE